MHHMNLTTKTLDVMERRDSTTNLDLATPDSAEHPQNQPLPSEYKHNVPMLSTSPHDGILNQPQGHNQHIATIPQQSQIGHHRVSSQPL